MADNTVNIEGGKSAVEVAYTLLVNVAVAESKHSGGSTFMDCDRKYILDTFAECLSAAKGYRRV